MYLKRCLYSISFIFCFAFCLVPQAQKLKTDSLFKALSIAKDEKEKLNCLKNIGLVLRREGDCDSAMVYTNKALILAKKLNDSQSLAGILLNIGVIYRLQGNYPSALDNDFKALALYQKLKNKKGEATQLGNIGLVFWNQGNLPKALKYSYQALAICEVLKDSDGIARNLSNIGIIHYEGHDFMQALTSDSTAMVIERKLGDKVGIAANYGNLGNVYSSLGNNEKALEYDFKALAMDREIGDNNGAARNLGNIGSIYSLLKNYKLARIYLDSGLAFAQAEKYTETIRNNYYWLSWLDTNTNDYRAALHHYMKYISYRDSLDNQANTKKTMQSEMNFVFQHKQDSLKSEEDKKDLIAASENKRQRVISFSVGLVLLLVLIFVVFISRSLRITRKQKELIEIKSKETEEQKKAVEERNMIIEEKNKDILDSIRYAKQLQDAILPPLPAIEQYLPESFLLYKPKDIVAGDFYWIAQDRNSGGTLIAACDCTGHGVPGAMVSVVCSNALNRAVKEFKLIEPGEILDKVRELVLETFEKSATGVKDGMDVSLASITSTEKGILLKWAGAYNPLWYIENGEFKEIPGDKQPVGQVDNPKPFITHTINITKSSPSESGGTVLYLLTDGYADQFGGPKGKKFKYKQLQELLVDNAHLTMQAQKHTLDKTFENWKGDLEQTDDVCIIGIKV